MAESDLSEILKDPRPLRILYLDLNAYFASVEQAEDPRLRGVPVGVCPVMADSSFIIAASYEAKRFGVKTGTQIGEARRLCPEIKLVPAQPGLYTHYHRKVLEVAEQVLPIEKVCSIDEMRFRLIGSEQTPENAQGLAQRMKAALRDDLSPCLTCSIGIAPNSFLAKLGTDLQKPDGLVILRAEDLPGRIQGLALTEFAGINRKMESRLKAAGIFNSTDLLARTPAELRAAFGSVIGDRWWYLLRGYDLELPETSRKSLGHSHVLPPEFRTDQGCREVLLRLIGKATARLRANDLYAQSISFSVKGFSRTWHHQQRMPATHDTVVIQGLFLDAWERRDFEKPRAVSITFSELCGAEAIQPSLFEEIPDREEFNAALDNLNQKFGKNTVYLAGMQRAKDTAKEKIAFHKTDLFSEGRDDNQWPDTFRGIPRPPED